MADVAFRMPSPLRDGHLSDGADLQPAPHPRPFRVVAPPRAKHVEAPEAAPSLADVWGGLIERIHSTASRLREEEARLRERDEQLQNLARRTKEEVQAASERVLRAEIHAHEAEAKAMLEIVEWQNRALAAEERVHALEGWLASVREAITTEFA